MLSSLVGDASATAAVAATDGTISATALPSVNVTNVTTAEAVLTAQALGKAPTSSADIAAAQGQFSSDQTIQMATAIKLVADAGVALPAGAANTLALVSNPTGYTSFVTYQATNNATVFNNTEARRHRGPEHRDGADGARHRHRGHPQRARHARAGRSARARAPAA